jgi:hypothetical protein
LASVTMAKSLKMFTIRHPPDAVAKVTAAG